MSAPEPSNDDLLNEFVNLNRRRIFGTPPLGIPDLERWQWLRETLEERLGDRLRSLLATVERRAHFRFSSHLEVCFGSGDELRSACMENVSEGGIFVATDRPLPAGTPLRLKVTLPDGAVDMTGRVAWARSAANEMGPAGMGVRFENLSPEQREKIAAVVAQQAAPEGNA